ncbi:MAG: hypothetical protein KBD56_06955 [Candidatus Eisenbacteria bacterium]|nr:hypothetical protein [Candidatus Eisenbacteria bacterium]
MSRSDDASHPNDSSHSDDSSPSSIPSFGRKFFESDETFTRIGDGEIGGKAAGLALVRERILPKLSAEDARSFVVAVPTLAVLGTGLFERFMARNRLYEIALSDEPDDRIALAFQQADLPAEFVGDLRALIRGVHTPLAIRSSSLLEDALAHPFAGVYGTKMIPNNQPDADTRFRRLIEAIKFVYASTFFHNAKSYQRSIQADPRDERMAVIIQEVVGRRYDGRYYPAISGVARSFNYYPTGHARPEDGVIDLALGLGKQIVDGGRCWTYSPAFPAAPPPFGGIDDLMKNTQTRFWAVHMGPPPLPDPIHETEYLVETPIGEAEEDGALHQQVSSYDPQSDRLRPGLGAAGPRVIDFAPILVGRSLPLNDLVRSLIARSTEALGAEVEIEFAVDAGARSGEPDGPPARFGFLQARPMMVAGEEVTVEAEELRGEAVVLASEQVLGNGVRTGIRDIVFLDPEAFDPAFTRDMAGEIDRLNAGLVATGVPYILVGFGRWGSSDPWLGVPVEWSQIGGARVIVEATLPAMNPDLSQGSHFFHNLIGFQVFYLSVRHAGPHRIDWHWLRKQETIASTRFVRHVRAADPLLVRVDGRRNRGVITRAAEHAAPAAKG